MIWQVLGWAALGCAFLARRAVVAARERRERERTATPSPRSSTPPGRGGGGYAESGNRIARERQRADRQAPATSEPRRTREELTKHKVRRHTSAYRAGRVRGADVTEPVERPQPPRRRREKLVRQARASNSTTPSLRLNECICGAPLPKRRNWNEVRRKQEFKGFPDPDPYHHLCDKCHRRRKNGLREFRSPVDARRWNAVIGSLSSDWKQVTRSSVWYCDICKSTIPAGVSSWSVFLRPPLSYTVAVCNMCSECASTERELSAAAK